MKKGGREGGKEGHSEEEWMEGELNEGNLCRKGSRK
jgi:hypothetical protein